MLDEDAFYGRARAITLAAAGTARIHHLERRCVTVKTTGAGVVVTMPAPAGLMLGGPYFFVFSDSTSTDDFDLEDGDGAAVATLAPGERVVVTLEATAGGRAFKATPR